MKTLKIAFTAVIIVAVSSATLTENAAAQVSNSTRYLQRSRAQLRFSRKIQFDENVAQEMRADIKATFPLGSQEYPLSEDLCVLLRESNSHSVVMPYDYEVKYDVDKLIEIAGGAPPHAPVALFWPLFEEVIDYQIRRRSRGHVLAMSERGMPWLNLPNLWENFTVNDVAEAVHNEVSIIEQST